MRECFHSQANNQNAKDHTMLKRVKNCAGNNGVTFLFEETSAFGNIIRKDGLSKNDFVMIRLM